MHPPDDDNQSGIPPTPTPSDKLTPLPPTPVASSIDMIGEGSAIAKPQSIGPYRIRQRLGEGGMGIVYLAEQTKPIHRRVAIKVLKPGMDSEAILHRFEAERQVLERMDHPNIASILDAGMTDLGRPFFVMEYVKGLPITEHADRAKLSIEERLELFVQVCEAVQHAHFKGVIHRDLKPNNILVAWDQSRSVPKVIDFGVARITDRDANDPAFTQHGQLIGTPEYMSPEQAEMSAQDIDTRTDVYALGVVLYELLTGLLPFASATLREAGVDAIRSIIRESDPPIPSKRLQTLNPDAGTTLATLSKSRQTDQRRLLRLLRTDLDWVVMRCLEKRRDRRYGTPSELALDIKRFLNGEPVLTGPPRITYRIAKAARRYRTPIAAAGLALAGLVAGLVATTIMWQHAEAMRQRAEDNDTRTRALATRIVSTVADDVATLPGARQAREAVLNTGIPFLTEQADNNALTPEQRLDLADALDRSADLAAALRSPNSNELERAAQLQANARSIRIDLEAHPALAARATIGLAHSDRRAGDLAYEKLDYDEADNAYRAAIARLETLSPTDAETRDAQLARANTLIQRADALRAKAAADAAPGSARQQAIQLLQQADDITEALARRHADDEVYQARGRALARLGSAHLAPPADNTKARSLLQRAEPILRNLADSNPIDSTHRRRLAGTLYTLAIVHRSAGDTEAARLALNECRRHFAFLTEADPHDLDARVRLSQVDETRASFTDDNQAKVELQTRAIANAQIAHQQAPTPANTRRLANQHYNLVNPLHTLGRTAEADRAAANAFDYYRALIPAGALADDDAQTLVFLAQARRFLIATATAPTDPPKTPENGQLRTLAATLRDTAEQLRNANNLNTTNDTRDATAAALIQEADSAESAAPR